MRRHLLPLLPATLAILVLAALPADAQSVSGRVSLTAGILRFDAMPGFANNVKVKHHRNPDGSDQVTISDIGTLAVSSAGCVSLSARQVSCTGSIKLVTVELGDGNDHLLLKGSIPMVADGGPGNDVMRSQADVLVRLIGGTGDDRLIGERGPVRLEGGPGHDVLKGGPSDDLLIGGPGPDLIRGRGGNNTVRYEDRLGTVQVTRDGLPNDGEPGEFDNVGSDVQNVDIVQPGATPGATLDGIVYGDHVPSKFRGGPSGDTAFTLPFTAQELTSDPVSNFTYKALPGLVNPLGTLQWGSDTFGKYIFSGSFRDFAYPMLDQRIPIIDSEKRTICDFDPNPGVSVIADQRSLTVANPNGRQSRIYFAGDGQNPGRSLGYISADLDVDDPCQWTATVITADEMNAGLAPDELACPQNICQSDGIAVLWHDDVAGDPFGRDYVLVPNYSSARLAVIRVDAAGVTPLDVYVLPTNVVMSPGCSTDLNPVQRPSVDPTRPKSDIRFASFFDEMRCVGTKHGQEYRIDLTAANPTVVPTSPLFRPLGPDGHTGGGLLSLSLYYDSQGGLWVWYADGSSGPPHVGIYRRSGAGDTCTINGGAQPAPAGEHCFFGAGPIDQQTFVNADRVLNFQYTGPGGRNASAIAQLGSTMYMAGLASWQRAQLVSGEWQLDPPSAYKVATPNLRLPAEGRQCADINPPGTTSCFCNPDSPPLVFPAFAVCGSNQCDACVAAGTCGTACFTLNPDQPQPWSCQPVLHTGCECAPGTDPTIPTCDDVSGLCTPNQTCAALPETAVVLAAPEVLPLGGSPPTLWLPTRSLANSPAPVKTNLEFSRVPIPSALPGTSPSGRAAIAWDGDRLWLVGTNSGSLAFRMRDDGLWSPWFNLPAGPAASVGATVVADSSGVDVFAVSSAGQVLRSTLTSARSCTPASCTWSAWTSLGITGATTNVAPGAARDPAGRTLVAIRAASDGSIQQALVGATTWTPIGGLAAAGSPAATWNTGEQGFWIVARDATSKEIALTRVVPGQAPASPIWEAVARHESQAPWATDPAIAWNGEKAVVVAARSDGVVFAATHAGAWAGWARAESGLTATLAPAAASVNGDVNLVASAGGVAREALLLDDTRCAATAFCDAAP